MLLMLLVVVVVLVGSTVGHNGVDCTSGISRWGSTVAVTNIII